VGKKTPNTKMNQENLVCMKSTRIISQKRFCCQVKVRLKVCDVVREIAKTVLKDISKNVTLILNHA
jgi:hypothetical protein